MGGCYKRHSRFEEENVEDKERIVVNVLALLGTIPSLRWVPIRSER